MKLTSRNRGNGIKVPFYSRWPLVLAIPPNQFHDEFLICFDLVRSSKERAHRCALPSIVAGGDANTLSLVDVASLMGSGWNRRQSLYPEIDSGGLPNGN